MGRTYRWIRGGLVGPSLSLVVKLVQCRGEPVRVLLAQIIDRGELGVRKGAQVAQGERKIGGHGWQNYQTPPRLDNQFRGAAVISEISSLVYERLALAFVETVVCRQARRPDSRDGQVRT